MHSYKLSSTLVLELTNYVLYAYNRSKPGDGKRNGH